MKNTKINKFLRSINKADYISLFEKNNISYNDLKNLSENDLQKMGVEKTGDRIHIISEIEKNVISTPQKILRFSQRHLSFFTIGFSLLGIIIASLSICFALKSLKISESSLNEMQQQRELAYQPDLIPEEIIWKVIYSRNGIGHWRLHYVDQSINNLDSIKSYVYRFNDNNINIPHKIPIRNLGIFSAKKIKIILYPLASLDSIRQLIKESNVKTNINRFLNPTLEMEFYHLDLKKEMIDSAKYIYSKSFQFLSADINNNVLYLDVPIELHKFIMSIAMIKANKTDMPDWATKVPDMFRVYSYVNMKIEYENFFGKIYKKYFEIKFSLVFQTGPGGIRTDGKLELDRDHLFYFGNSVTEIDSITFWDNYLAVN